MKFKFEMSERVRIKESGEDGIVIGRAEYETADNDYFIRYTNGNGCAVQQWWTESALEAAA